RIKNLQDPDRARPVSYGGVTNTYGNMKITEAIGLENRVNELEVQVADLRSIIANSGSWPPANGFDHSPAQSFSRPDSDTAVAPEESVRGFEQVSPRGSVVRHDHALSVLEGMDSGDTKRSTISTIRPPR